MLVALLAIATISITVLLYLLTYWQKTKLLSTATTRRLSHLFSGLYILIVYPRVPTLIFLIICASFAIFMLISRRQNIFTCVHAIDRKTYGENLFSVAGFVTALISWHRPDIFYPAICVLTFSDLAAGITGDFLKSKSKTVLGSLVFAAVTFLILAWFNVPLEINLVMSLILVIIERVAKYGFDNLLLPVATAILLRLFV